MVQANCPTCGDVVTAPDDSVDGTGRCATCGELVRFRAQPECSAESAPLPPRIAPSTTNLFTGVARSTSSPAVLIPCYVCKNQIADNASTCPKCGAIQTQAGREQGRRFKKQTQLLAGILTLVICLPLVSCCAIGIFGGGSSKPREPEKWNMEQLKRDVDAAVRDPNSTIIVPADGGQPIVVPDR
jgi:hypothetical protein